VLGSTCTFEITVLISWCCHEDVIHLYILTLSSKRQIGPQSLVCFTSLGLVNIFQKLSQNRTHQNKISENWTVKICSESFCRSLSEHGEWISFTPGWTWNNANAKRSQTTRLRPPSLGNQIIIYQIITCQCRFACFTNLLWRECCANHLTSQNLNFPFIFKLLICSSLARCKGKWQSVPALATK
jgi:hypothetical protein